jgi:outer membrane protein TolC
MRAVARLSVALAASLGLALGPQTARGENLAQAWSIALGVNQGLQAQQAQSAAQGYNFRAAKSARLPSVHTFNFEAFSTATPSIRSPLASASTATAGGGAGGAASSLLAGLPTSFPLFGAGQRQFPFSLTFASVPLYTGGRILRSIDAAGAVVDAQRTEEFKTALDLKLIVVQAYIGVLRAQKILEVSRSNVGQLESFARDVRNRREQGMAIRSDELAAEVSLANARLAEIQARTALESAWATYNRYLCRPLSQVVPLEELTTLSPHGDWKELAEQAVRDGERFAVVNEEEVRDLSNRAIRNRPEPAGLSAQARALGAQAEANLGVIKPQVSFTMAYIFLGPNNLIPQGYGAAAFVANWTITDGGATRRRSAALRQQEVAALKRRDDVAADIALEVRTRWLDLQQNRQRVPVARLAVAQAEENNKVLADRYRQQLSNYTEVLDAETRRVQSLTNFYNAVYDESLALFRLRRAVGDL